MYDDAGMWLKRMAPTKCNIYAIFCNEPDPWSGVSFITAHVAYVSTNKTETVSIKKELSFFSPRVDMPHIYMYMHAWILHCFCTFIITQKIWKTLTAMVDSCAVIKKYPFSGITSSDRVWRKMPDSQLPCSDSECVTIHYMVNIQGMTIIFSSLAL